VQSDLMGVLSRNPELMRRAKFLNVAFAVSSGGERQLVTVKEGSVTVAKDGARPSFTIEASASAWEEFSRPEPRPGFNDVIAMAESGHATVTGDDLLPFFQNLLFIKGVVAAMFKGDARW
jgi:putative sterol carrier protein